MMSILKFKIVKIVKSKFYIQKTDKLDNLQMTSSYQFEVNTDEFVVLCRSQFEYTDGEKTVMDIEIECYFKVEEEFFNSLIKDNVLTLHPNILQYLATIAVGTARGEIHARCESAHSILQEVVLPPINLTQIITTPSEYKL